MREAGMVEVDRQDRSQAVASLRSAGGAIARGIHIWIAPEGTRSRSGELGPLRKGGFHLAREAGAPILPVAIRGSRAILPAEKAIVQRGARVDIVFGAPIELAGQDLRAVMDQVRSFLERHLER
jgi:1-acyl-sn-glycerol-3-phosphate acyltransferase